MRTFLTVLLALLLVAPARAQVAAPDALVGGKSLGEWNAEFFKWLLPIHTNQSPSLDTTGMFAHVGQPDGPVFFVTKGANFQGLPPRTFEVEEGKYLYLGLTTTYVDTVNDDPPKTAEELMDIASGLIMLIDGLHLAIGGVPVPDLFSYRAKSPAFSIDITEPGSNYERSYGGPFTGLLDPMVADGYAVLIEPLPPGVHVIRWGGHVGPPLDRGTDVTVSITVVPIPPARRIQELIDAVVGADLPRGQQSSLIKTLEAARSSFEADDPQVGVSQLRAFQRKVRAYLTRKTKEDAALAKQLLQLAQQVIDRATAAVAQPNVLPNDAIVEGRTLGEWTTEWWKWILSIPTNQNPGLDTDGSHAGNGQPGGGVFFLANIAGQGGAVSRTFTVPEGSRLLFPARFVSLDNVDFPLPLSPEELRDTAATVVDLMTNLYTVVDGTAFDVSAHRVRSPVFSFEFGSEDNLDSFVYGHPVSGLVDPIVSDGYWLMVEPLPVGSHTIRFGGQIGPPFNSSKDVSAFITVVAVPLTQRVQELVVLVESAGLPGRRTRPLLETLRKAQDAFESDHLRAGIVHLRVFQHKLRHLAQSDPVLVEQLTQAAQKIIDKATERWNRQCLLKKVEGKENE